MPERKGDGGSFSRRLPENQRDRRQVRVLQEQPRPTPRSTEDQLEEMQRAHHDDYTSSK